MAYHFSFCHSVPRECGRHRGLFLIHLKNWEEKLKITGRNEERIHVSRAGGESLGLSKSGDSGRKEDQIEP